MRLCTLAVPTLFLLSAVPAQAQQAAPTVVLVMTREQFRPGNMPAHNRQIPSFYALFDKAKVGAYRQGLLPLSGDQNHLLYIETHPSYGEWEAVGKRMEEVMGASPALQAEFDALTKANDPLHESQSVMIAVRRAELSYHSRSPAELAKMRYISVNVTRVNVGRGPDYADYIKQTNAAREKLGLNEHSTVFAVSSGAPTGTFLTLSAAASLAESDASMAGGEARTKRMTEALGGDLVVKERQKRISEIVAAGTTTLYSVDRGLSRPSPEFIAADPDFWKPLKVTEPTKPAKK